MGGPRDNLAELERTEERQRWRKPDIWEEGKAQQSPSRQRGGLRRSMGGMLETVREEEARVAGVKCARGVVKRNTVREIWGRGRESSQRAWQDTVRTSGSNGRVLSRAT